MSDPKLMVDLIIMFPIEVALKWGKAGPFQLRNLNLRHVLLLRGSVTSSRFIRFFIPKHES